MIEDTFLILMLGADFTSIFWGRLIFVLVFVGIFVRLISLLSDETCERFLYKRIGNPEADKQK